MLDRIFCKVLSLDLAAIVALALVLIVRLFLKKAPKRCSYLLWSVVQLRLLIPFSIELPGKTFLPVNADTFTPEIALKAEPAINSGSRLVDSVVNSLLPAPEPVTSLNPLQVWLFIGETVWVFGMLIFAVLSLSKYLRLRFVLADAEKTDRILVSDKLETAFVLGIFKPVICLPAGLGENERSMIIEHESTHIRRKDHIVKVIAYLMLVIHWYNPLIWLAFALAMRDMEMSCDESVINRLGNIRSEYGEALLRLSVGKEILPAVPPTFGEGAVKERIVNVMKYKTSNVIVDIVAVIAAALIMTACTLTGNSANSFTVELSDSRNAAFKLNITLPDGWSIDTDAKKEQYYDMYGGIYNIYNDGEYVGFIGCGSYPDYSLESDPEQYPEPFSADYYKAVYPELRLPAHYYWDISPEPLKRTSNGETALAVIYKQIPEDGVSAAAWETLEKPGIVSYDDDKHVYVMIELEPSVSEEVQRAIAESISLE